MAFNPDEYLKKTPASSFDPDRYLSAEKQPVKEREEGAAQAFLEHYGNTASLGYLPQLQALTEKLMPDPNAELDERLRAEGFDLQEPSEKYLEARDANIKRLQQQSVDFPKASGAGALTGIAATTLGGIAAASRLGLAPAATLGGRMAQSAKTGAALGAVANPGDTEGEIDLLQLGDRTKNAALGGAIGAAAQGTMEGIGVGGTAAADWYKKKAREKAYRALGRQTPKTMEKAIATGKDQEIGETLLEEGAIPWLGTPRRIANRVADMKEEAGERVGSLIDDVQQNRAEFTPIKIKNPKRGTVVQEEVEFTPIRFDENPMKESMPWLRPEDAPPRLIRGEAQKLQTKLIEPPKPEVIAGGVRSVPVKGTTVSGKQIADDLLRSEDMRLLRKTPGMESIAKRVEQLAETLASNGEMTIRQAQALRQQIDKSINFTKRVPEMRGIEPFLYQIRTAIRNRMNDAVNRTGTASKDALLKANRRYGNLAEAEDILEGEIGRQANNRAVSLTDTIVGAGGMSAGGPMTGIALAALNKAGRTFGNSMQARTYDTMSKILKHSPKLAAIAEKNPVAFQTLVEQIQTKMRGGPEYGSGEKHPLFKDQNVMNMLRKNPNLIQHIQDPRLRAQFQRMLAQQAPQIEGEKGQEPPKAPVSEDEARQQFLQGN